MESNKLLYLIKWTAVLTVFWLLLSGFLKPLLLFFGVVSVVLVVYYTHKMDKTDNSATSIPLGPKFLLYLGWLLKEVVLSSVAVAKKVWGSSDNLTPAIAKLPVKTVPKGGRVLYANSITLTPGTLSIDLDDDYVTVHALQESSLEELQSGEMASRVSRIGS